MHRVIFAEIENILNNPTLAAPILNIHLPKRAKFERYLQSVLANSLLIKYKDTEIEKEYPSNKNSHVDIYFKGTYVELKTPNTNYVVAGIKPLSKPITKNVQSVIDDINKLRSAGVDGVVAFVLFPIGASSNYLKHVARVKGVLGHKSYEEGVVGNFYVFSAKV